ncbi:MAG: efflux RND transporter periplasmic adaptor subunit [Deltaproteobacteria bacterium]|nr:efflux RND transporter periplasmic adaptor subunit [Deltaproteobacteria bacterium]
MNRRRSTPWFWGILLVLGLAWGAAWKFDRLPDWLSPSSPSPHHGTAAPTVYTCPMHPGIRADQPGDCPICGMRLVPLEAAPPPDAHEGHAPVPATPSNEHQGHGTESPTPPPSTSGAVRIPVERQQSIGMRTIVVSRMPATRHIRTVGRVAFDPELMVAQREFVEALRLGDRSLIEAATLHLRHMGVSDGELTRLRKQRREEVGLFLPHAGGSVWVYAPLFEHELPLVAIGTAVTITAQGTGDPFQGIVRSLDPIVDPQTRTARARIEVTGAGGVLRPDTFVNTEIIVPLGEQLVIPLESLIDTGKRKVVLVQSAGDLFTPREITTGAQVDAGVVVTGGLTEGETVVARAAFLVNSESSLKAGLGSAVQHAH